MFKKRDPASLKNIALFLGCRDLLGKSSTGSMFKYFLDTVIVTSRTFQVFVSTNLLGNSKTLTSMGKLVKWEMAKVYLFISDWGMVGLF